MTRLPFKPNWGRRPNRMAAALYYARKKRREGLADISPGMPDPVLWASAGGIEATDGQQLDSWAMFTAAGNGVGPYYREAGFNGRPFVEFLGNDNRYMSMPLDLWRPGIGASIYIVARLHDSPWHTHAGMLSFGGGTGSDWDSPSLATFTEDGDGSTAVQIRRDSCIARAPDYIGRWAIFEMHILPDGTTDILVDGAMLLRDCNPGGAFAPELALLSARWNAGAIVTDSIGRVDIAEVIGYDVVLDGNQRMYQRNLLREKWFGVHTLPPVTAGLIRWWTAADLDEAPGTAIQAWPERMAGDTAAPYTVAPVVGPFGGVYSDGTANTALRAADGLPVTGAGTVFVFATSWMKAEGALVGSDPGPGDNRIGLSPWTNGTVYFDWGDISVGSDGRLSEPTTDQPRTWSLAGRKDVGRGRFSAHIDGVWTTARDSLSQYSGGALLTHRVNPDTDSSNDAEIFEIMVFDRWLEEAEIAELHAWAKARWGTAYHGINHDRTPVVHNGIGVVHYGD